MRNLLVVEMWDSRWAGADPVRVIGLWVQKVARPRLFLPDEEVVSARPARLGAADQ